MTENGTIWIHFQQGKYYRIPDGEELPAGDASIYTLSGLKKDVDADALAAWEIPAETAQAHVQLGVLQFLGVGREPAATEAGAVGPQFVRISAPDLARLFSALAGVLEDSIADDPGHIERARERLRALRDRARSVGSEIDPIVVEMLPKVVHSSYAASRNPESFHQVVEWLRSLAAQFEQSGEGGTADVVQILSRLNQFAGSLFASPREETPEERQARYREMARQAMPEIPKPDVRKMVDDYLASKREPEA